MPHRSAAQIDAGRAQEKQLLGVGTKGFVDDFGLDAEALMTRPGWNPADKFVVLARHKTASMRLDSPART